MVTKVTNVSRFARSLQLSWSIPLYGHSQQSYTDSYIQRKVSFTYFSLSKTAKPRTRPEMEKAYKIAQMNILAPKIAQKHVFHVIFQFAPKQRKFP